MEHSNAFLQIGVLAASGFASLVWDGNSELLNALLFFMALDYISGLCSAVALKKLSSYVGFKGIAKKMLIIVLVAVCGLLDRYILVSEGFIQGMVTLFYISNECISIVENAHEAGIPIPKQLSSIIGKLKHSADKSDDGNKHEK